MPVGMHAPMYEKKSWRPFFKKLPKEGMESRTVNLKGKSETVDVWVWKK